jgi:iron complex transport system substrate-binding protein
MGVSSRASARLRDLGRKVVTLEPHTLAGMRRVIRRLAATLQVHGATALIAKIDAGIAAAARLVPADVRGERVYFEVSPAPYAAGRDSFVGELLHEIGLTNIIGAGLGPFPKINPELVVRANPDLIMVSGESAAELARRPGWSHIRALQDGAVCVFNAAQRNILVRPGPRTPEAARLMAECAAHPAAFR